MENTKIRREPQLPLPQFVRLSVTCSNRSLFLASLELSNECSGGRLKQMPARQLQKKFILRRACSGFGALACKKPLSSLSLCTDRLQEDSTSQIVLVWRLEKYLTRYHCQINQCVTKWSTSSDLSVFWQTIALHAIHPEMVSYRIIMYTKAVALWHLTTLRNLPERLRPPGMLLRPP